MSPITPTEDQSFLTTSFPRTNKKTVKVEDLAIFAKSAVRKKSQKPETGAYRKANRLKRSRTNRHSPAHLVWLRTQANHTSKPSVELKIRGQNRGSGKVKKTKLLGPNTYREAEPCPGIPVNAAGERTPRGQSKFLHHQVKLPSQCRDLMTKHRAAGYRVNPTAQGGQQALLRD